MFQLYLSVETLTTGIVSPESISSFLESLSTSLLHVVQIVGFTLILLTLLVIVAWLSSGGRQIRVLPFETPAGEDKFCGRALADLFLAEWRKILFYHSEMDTLGVKPVRVASMPRERESASESGTLTLSGEGLSMEVSDVATVGVAQTTVSIGQVLATLKKMWPIGGTDTVLLGSFQRYGTKASLTMRLESSKFHAWEVTAEIGEDDSKINELVKDLAYKVLHRMEQDAHLTPEPVLIAVRTRAKITRWVKQHLFGQEPSRGSFGVATSARTWKAFEHFSKALAEYWQYQSTRAEDDLEEARKNCIKAIQLEDGYWPVAEMLVALGIEYSEGADPAVRSRSKAEELFRYATTLEPNPDLLARRQRLLRETVSEEELSDRRKLISDSFGYLGISLISTGDLSHSVEALAAVRKATDLDPDSALAFGNRAIVEDLVGRREEAEANHRKAIELSEQAGARWISNSFTVSAQLLWFVGRFSDAWNRAQMGIETYGSYLDNILYPPHGVKAHLLLMEGKVDEAIRLYDEIMESHPDFTALRSEAVRARMERVLVEAQDNQMPHFDERLVAYIEDSITLDPRQAYPRFLMGYVRSLQGDYDAAVEAYKTAVEREPNNAGYHAYLAYCYQQSGRKADWEKQIEEAREVVEESEGEFKYHRACLEAVAENVDEALDLFEDAMNKKHESLGWARWDPTLESIRDKRRFAEILDLRESGQRPRQPV